MIVKVLAAIGLVALVAPAVSARCAGDCNDNGAVTIEELITGVNVALGQAAVSQCPAIDGNGDNRATIEELIAAVNNALGECGVPFAGALRESASVAVAPIQTIISFGRVGGAGGGGGSVAAARATAGRPAGASGCQTFECPLGGTEEVCCSATAYTLRASSCAFVNDSGITIERDGFFELNSADRAVCTGSVPAGAGFQAAYDRFFARLTDPSGNFVEVNLAFTESFTPLSGGCTLDQPDPFGFGVRGDGLRTLDGLQRIVAGDAGGTLFTAADTETEALQLLVVSVLGDNGLCRVGAEIDGAASTTDFLTKTQFHTTYAAFDVIEVPLVDGSLVLSFDGTVGTDCLGGVDVTTLDLLRLVPGDACLTGGRLQLTIAEGTATVAFTAGGGLEFDFGANGSIDERFDHCTDSTGEVCEVAQAPGACVPCDDTGDCQAGLDCYECAFNCTGTTTRCATAEDFALCEDGIF